MTKLKSLDALAFDTEKTSKMDLIYWKTDAKIKDKDGKTSYIELKNTDSKAAQEKRDISQKRIYEQLNKNSKITLSREQTKEEEIDLLVDSTVGWYLVNPETKEDLGIEFSPENAYVLYTNQKFAWIKEQVEDFIRKRANFT